MGQTLVVVAGSDGGPWTLVILGEDGLPTSFPPDATLEATAWRGGDGAPLFAPAAAWVDPASATFTLATAALDTAGLEPGTYALQAFAASGGARTTAFDGHLEVLPTAGTATAREPYCTGADLRRRYDQIATLANNRSDTTEFLDVRVEVSDLLDRKLVLRYETSGGQALVRHDVPHPILGILDWADPTAVPPSKADLTSALAAGGLVVEAKVVVLTALWSIAEVLERQQVAGRTDYRDEADRFRARFEQAWQCYQAVVDLSGGDYPQKATYPTALFDRDVVLLPPGTSP